MAGRNVIFVFFLCLFFSCLVQISFAQQPLPERSRGEVNSFQPGRIVSCNERLLTIQLPQGITHINLDQKRQIVVQERALIDELQLGLIVRVLGNRKGEGRLLAHAIIVLNNGMGQKQANLRGGGLRRQSPAGRITSLQPLRVFLFPFSREIGVDLNSTTKIIKERVGAVSDLTQGSLVLIRQNTIIKLPEDDFGGRGSISLPAVVDRGPSLYDPKIIESKKESPFGLFDPNMQRMQHLKTFNDFPKVMSDLGVYWASFGATFSFNWNLLQEEGGSHSYNWERVDSLIRLLQKNNIQIIAYIKASEPGQSLKRVKPSLPANMDHYKAFVRAVVERYDGDGFSDMEGLRFPIKYWSIEDEPLSPIYFDGTGSDYAQLVVGASEAIRQSDREAHIIVSMLRGTGWLEKAGDPREFMLSFFRKLASLADKTPYDIIDQHWLGTAPNVPRQLQYSQYREWLADIESTAAGYGFAQVPFFNLELAGSSESEILHASDLVKRHVFLLALGVKKLLWSGLKAADEKGLTHKQKKDYFRQVALLNGNGDYKLASWSYKFIVEKLEGLDWADTRIIKENDDGLFIYQFGIDDQPLWVMWSDTTTKYASIRVPKNGKEISIVNAVPPFVAGDGVPDYKSAFPVSHKKISGGTVQIEVDSIPRFVSITEKIR